MNRQRRLPWILAFLTIVILAVGKLAAAAGIDDYLSMNAKRAKDIALSMRVNGQVGKSLDLRVIRTERSYNYKLRATWLTSDVIGASARLVQLAEGLTDEQTRKLIEEAETPGRTVILVEIDPREGSGVIPRDWIALFGPPESGAGSERAVRGESRPQLREVKALGGAGNRNYSYDIFWVVFPLKSPEGKPLFGDSDSEAELSVRIYDKIGRVRWKIPESIRQR